MTRLALWLALCACVLGMCAAIDPALSKCSAMPTRSEAAEAALAVDCWLYVGEVRPTEFAYGPTELAQTKEAIERHWTAGGDDWAQHQAHTVVPIVLGPDGFYAVDKHHRCLGLHRAHIPADEKKVLCRIVSKRPSLSVPDFLHYMFNNEFLWTSDAKGLHEMDPHMLPPSWDEMLPDPYRDLAGYVRAHHGFDGGLLYVEFHWANFFRERIPFPLEPRDPALGAWCHVRPYDNACVAEDFDESAWVHENLAQAIDLSQSPEASHLLGYHPGVVV